MRCAATCLTTEQQQKQAKKEQQQFGWASAARSSVQQYRKTVSSKRPKPPNTPRQQQQQQQQPSPAVAAASDAAPSPLQPEQKANIPSSIAGAEASTAVESRASTEADTLSGSPPHQQQQQQQERDTRPVAGSSGTSSTSSAGGVPSDAAAGGSSSDSRAALSLRKQQMLQRMKGAAASAAAAADSSAPTAAAAPAAAPAAAAATAAAAAASAPLFDAEGQVLLQELLELAEQLAGPDGYNSVIDSDPLSDPLAGFLGDDGDAGFSAFVEPYVDDAQGAAAGFNNGVIPGDGFDAAGFDYAEAEELFAAVSELQQRGFAAAEALAADDAAAAAGSSGSSRPGSLAAELLAWEAEELAKQPQIDIEAAAAAMQRGEVLGGDLADDAEDEYEDGDEDEYELDREDEDWLEQNPQLKQMLQADGAAFAQMLAAVNGDDEPGSSSSSAKGTATAAAVSQRGVSSAEAEQQESWASLGLQDWLEASGSSAVDGGVHSPADEELLSEEAGLSDLLSQIDADPSLDRQAKIQAKMSIQGVFNDPAAAAGSGSSRKRADKGSSKKRLGDEGLTGSQQQQQQQRRAAASAAAAAAGDQQQEAPALLPKPVRPASPAE
jgi:hypothetical protein